LLEVVVSGTVRVMTPEAFEKSEAEKKEISKIAEEHVLQSERERLNSMGAIKQAQQIDHIAIRNVAAGYDIASFNGKNSENKDRFIEVKAGKSTPIRFFISRNELETAKRLRAQYYIYYVCVKDKTPKDIYVFQDPSEGVMKDPKFKICIDTYEISEK
jgi:hypothetical protein